MKNILVTGCSRGLGLQICKTLLEEGYCVYGLNRTISEELVKLQLKFPDKLQLLKYDLENSQNVKNLIFDSWLNIKIPIHGFVNNAANAYDDIITNMNHEKLEYMFRVNVFTPMQIIKYVLRNMIFNRVQCSIVHVSSISVHTGYKGLAMYASTKGALEAFSKNSSREWGAKGLRSNCIVAGFMETDMSSTLDSTMKSKIFNRTSLKIPTSLESVASTVKFLLSNEAKSITGQNIFVDSGTI
jgi:3-oxoacyl-[acyl-carrier protein] reductase